MTKKDRFEKLLEDQRPDIERLYEKVNKEKVKTYGL